jgi:hypothetical protein
VIEPAPELHSISMQTVLILDGLPIRNITHTSINKAHLKQVVPILFWW